VLDAARTRVLYRINESSREVIVLRIEHRRDAYR
jgi:mRNA-degrading endonuclease RelE of RelBE toxin-antitoxin system